MSLFKSSFNPSSSRTRSRGRDIWYPLRDYRTTLESLISVASRAADIFERSKIEQKRELIAFLFSNLRLKGKKLEFSLRSPFDLMVNRRDHSSWLPFLDTYRTMCLAPQPDFRRVLEGVLVMQRAAWDLGVHFI